jgi:hypothetical protein
MTCCRKCGIEKPETDFYASERHSCKSCVCARVRAHRRINDSVREYDNKRAKLPHRKQLNREVSNRWRENNITGYKAHNILNNSVRDKKIHKQSCSVCGSSHHVHGHHKDYTNPLDVVWLCARCHHRHHAGQLSL